MKIPNYLKTKKEIKEYSDNYKKKRRENRAKYYLLHKEQLQKYEREWRKKNLEKCRERGRINAAKWRKKNLKKYRDYQKEWHKKAYHTDSIARKKQIKASSSWYYRNKNLQVKKLKIRRIK